MAAGKVDAQHAPVLQRQHGGGVALRERNVVAGEQLRRLVPQQRIVHIALQPKERVQLLPLARDGRGWNSFLYIQVFHVLRREAVSRRDAQEIERVLRTDAVTRIKGALQHLEELRHYIRQRAHIARVQFA